MPVTQDDEPSPQPWHNSTPAVLGASAVGVAVIAVVVGVISLVTGPADPPAEAPLNFVEPSFSASRTSTSAPTTTATITSTARLSTTEINAPLAPPTTSGTPGSSESSSPPSQEEDDDGPTTRTPRRAPRTNITRTLVPGPIG